MSPPAGPGERGWALWVDRRLLPAWQGAGPPGVELRGLAAAAGGGRVAAVVVTDRPLDDAELRRLGTGLAEQLGVRGVELVALDAAQPSALARQWANQAAQGSGRGVRAELVIDPVTGTPAELRVSALDSSARELVFRLASAQEPALAALRALLACPELAVVDAEDPTAN